MKIYACYSIYNNADYLFASLATVSPHVDKVIVVDGKYHSYPGTTIQSNDLTPLLLTKYRELYPDKLIYVPATDWKTQVDKRNAYLDLVPENAWLFIVDGDEIPYGQIGELRETLEKHNERMVIAIPVVTSDSIKYYPRIIKKKEGMRYKHYHWNINYEGKNILINHDPARIAPRILNLIHFKEYRPKEVLSAKEEYTQSLEKWNEREFIDQEMIDAIERMT
jgi:hypothetical protein